MKRHKCKILLKQTQINWKGNKLDGWKCDKCGEEIINPEMAQKALIKEKIIKKFFKLNPKLKSKNLFWRVDGRLEWHCEHGIGHTVYAPKGSNFVHGCDKCCQNIKIIKEQYEWPDENGFGIIY